MQVTFSSLLVWITILSSSYWYHSPKMKELVQFRDAIIDSCVIYANDLDSCIHNLQRQLFNKKKSQSRMSFSRLSPSYHNRSIQFSHHSKHNSSNSLPCPYSKSSHQSMIDSSNKYLFEERFFLIARNYEKLSKQQLTSNELIESLSGNYEKISKQQIVSNELIQLLSGNYEKISEQQLTSNDFIESLSSNYKTLSTQQLSSNEFIQSLSGNYEKLSKQQTDSNLFIQSLSGNYEKISKRQLASSEFIQSLSGRIEEYETEIRAMKAYMGILHKSLDYAIGNMTQQSGNLDKLAVKDSSIEAQMKFIQDAVRISQLHLRQSIHMQKNSSEWLKASLKNLTHSEQKIIDLYQHLFQLQIKEEETKPEPFNLNEFKLLLYLLGAGELLLFFVVIFVSCCRRPNTADINDNIKTSLTFSPRNGFLYKPNPISSQTILDEIRQRQLGDFVCSLSFTSHNQLHQELTGQIQRTIPDLKVEYFHVEYLNDIPSLPWAKTFLIFFDLKQKNGIDPIKGTDDIKVTVVKAVQRMGADIFMICTGDENSTQLHNSEALYHRSLKFLRTYHDIARLMSCKRVVSLKDSFFEHQINHIANAIDVWHESLD